MDAEFEFAQHGAAIGRGRHSAILPRMFAGGACAAAFVIAVGGCTNGGPRQEHHETRLVSLEAANSPGSSPWMESTTSPDLPRRLNRVEDTSAADTRTASGDQVGLYGGSANLAVCDRDQLVDFLEHNPVQAAAWRTAAQIPDIRAYASKLSPVVLLRDQRVTNHGFQNGEPTAFQSVLQTGTAVLVDDRGIPRVRCDSGSPLDEPQSDTAEEFTGTGWQGLKTDSVIKVRPSDAPIESLTVVSLPVAEAAPPPSSSDQTATPGASAPMTTAAPVSTHYRPPTTLLADIPLGQAVATPAPRVVLPPNTRVVPVDVAPLRTTLTSGTPTTTPTIATSSVTTIVPSTTPATTTDSVTSSDTTTEPSTTTDITTPSVVDSPSVIETATEDIEPEVVPTWEEPPLVLVPEP